MNIENKNKKYKYTESMVFSCQYHVIFTTKYRRSVLDENITKELKKIILEKQKEYEYEILEIEIMPDHVHLLIDVNPKIGIYNVVKKIKGYTSHELRNKFKSLRSRLPCLWTRGKFISTVGEVSLETVKKYIEEQKNK